MSVVSFLRSVVRGSLIVGLLVVTSSNLAGLSANAATVKGGWSDNSYPWSLADWRSNSGVNPNLIGDNAFDPLARAKAGLWWGVPFQDTTIVAFFPSEPFWSRAEPWQTGNIAARWNDAKSRIESDLKIILKCRLMPGDCQTDGAQKFLAIRNRAKHRTGWAEIGEVNRSINLAIRPISDLKQYGVIDYWASPLESLGREAGDCEDYAIAKYAILRDLGIAENDLRIAVVRDARLQQDHAILSVRVNGRWRLLDNRTFVMADAENVRWYEPMFLLGQAVNRVVAFESASPEQETEAGWKMVIPSSLN